jgi:hypothetical protein
MTLNGTSFAGSNGWRLPTWAELQTILLPEPSFPCSTDPCIDPVFDEPVGVDDYWTATTIAGHPEFAWYVQFGTGGDFYTGSDSKDNELSNSVRAVRGGLW